MDKREIDYQEYKSGRCQFMNCHVFVFYVHFFYYMGRIIRKYNSFFETSIVSELLNLNIMAINTSIVMQFLDSGTIQYCHSCSHRFRDDRRKHIQCSLTVCNKCYSQYCGSFRSPARINESVDDEDESLIDIENDMEIESNVNTYRDAEVQTDVSFPSDFECLSFASPEKIIERPISNKPSDSFILPFRRLSKSSRKCSVCDVYFSGPSMRFPDAARAQASLCRFTYSK